MMPQRKRHAALKFIPIQIDGEDYTILDKTLYDWLEWTYPVDKDGFLQINQEDYRQFLLKNARKVMHDYNHQETYN